MLLKGFVLVPAAIVLLQEVPLRLVVGAWYCNGSEAFVEGFWRDIRSAQTPSDLTGAECTDAMGYDGDSCAEGKGCERTVVRG